MRHVMRCAMVLVALVLFAMPAYAAGDAKGLIIPAPAAIFSAIVVFVLVLIVLWKAAWGPILAGLKRREETIQKALDDAKEASEEAKRLIAEYEARLDKAKEEAQAIADEARNDAEDIKSRIMSEAKAEADASIERAKREIDQMAHKAWDHLVKDAAKLATDAATKIIDHKLDETGHAEIVAGVVAEFAASRGGSAD